MGHERDANDAWKATGRLRTRDLAGTRQAAGPLLECYGITRVASLTALDVIGVPVYSAVRPQAATVAVSAGKGFSDDAAWISAVMESVEVATAEEFSPQVATVGAARELSLGYQVANLALHPWAVVDDTTILSWMIVDDLVSGKTTMVPTATVGLRGWADEAWFPSAFITTTNGLASGNNLAEALLYAMFELVERDALAQAERTRLAAASRYPSSALGHDARAVVEKLTSLGMTVTHYLLESVPPAAAAVTYLDQPDMPQVFGGSAAHLSAVTAVERSLLEAVQSRISVISGLRDDISPDSYPQDLPHFLGEAGYEKEWAPDMPPLADDGIGVALDRVVRGIHQRTNRPVLVAQLSEPGVFPAVVQVQAPGLLPSPTLPRRTPQALRGM